MRILLISPRPPYPVFGGLEVRVYRLFKALKERGHRISLVCTAAEELDRDSAAELHRLFDNVYVFPVTPPLMQPHSGRAIARRLSALFSPPIDYFDLVGYSKDMEKSIGSMLRDSRFDVIHLMGIKMARYIPDIRRYPSVCDCVDDYVLYCYRTTRYQTKLIDKGRSFFDALTAIAYERRFGGMFDQVTVVSPVDARVLKAVCPDARVSVLPLGVDSDYFSPAQKESEERTVMFSGVMDYEPNVTAVRHFCSAIFPRVRREVPDMRFLIVGRDPVPEIRQLGESVPDVTVTGFVDDIREYFKKSLVYVAPMKSGAGMKNKILEALAMGKPTVATSMSCDGIDVSDGSEILIADSPVEFAGHVVRLLNDKDLRIKLGRNARKKAVDTYSWDSQAAKLERIYQQVLWRRSGRWHAIPERIGKAHMLLGEKKAPTSVP